MEFKFSQWAVLLCFCAFGIQSALSFIQNMREIEQACARDGGFCINVMVPQPPRRRTNPNANRRGGAGRGIGAMAGVGAGMGAGRKATRTRKGSRPDPRALGQQHTRLPASAKATTGAAATAVGAAAAPPPYAAPPAQPAAQTPAPNNGFFFGGNSNDPFGNLFSMMMFQRKKRQAPAMMDPADIAEIPRRTAKQTMFSYLNAHCRKSEFDFGCRKTGGMCCLPFLK